LDYESINGSGFVAPPRHRDPDALKAGTLITQTGASRRPLIDAE
jgi:hypothetical protein